MWSLHHGLSPWQTQAMGMRLAMPAVHHLRQGHAGGRWSFMALGVREDQSNPHGSFWQITLFLS